MSMVQSERRCSKKLFQEAYQIWKTEVNVIVVNFWESIVKIAELYYGHWTRDWAKRNDEKESAIIEIPEM